MEVASMAENRTTIAVDAMGGDHGPQTVVPGVLNALRCEGAPKARLYGDQATLDAVLSQHDLEGLDIEVVPCVQDIEMGEAPASAIRKRPDSPIVRALSDHREGLVQAVVSAGSTGAMVAGSLMLLGRIPGVDRPAIATIVPTYTGHFLLLDVGANVQCTPEHLHCFARMGQLYCTELIGVETPRVGLLNIGEEASKGTELCIESHRLMAADPSLGFVGNVESRKLLFGVADVVVTDGFTGNMVLKLIEGFGAFLQKAASDHGGSSQPKGGDGLEALIARLDYATYGGALLLGVRGTSIIAHGSSSSLAITNAVRTAHRLASQNTPARLAVELAGP